MDKMVLTAEDIDTVSGLTDKYPLVLCVDDEKKWIIATDVGKFSFKHIEIAKRLIRLLEEELNKGELNGGLGHVSE